MAKQQSSTQQQIEQAQAELAQLQERKESLEERRSAAQDRQASAGADVDAHVQATMEVSGCDAALKHVTGQIQEAQGRLEVAQHQENKRRADELVKEIDAYFDDIMEQLASIHNALSTDELNDLLQRHSALDTWGANGRDVRRVRLQEALAKAIRSEPGWTVSGRTASEQEAKRRASKLMMVAS